MLKAHNGKRLTAVLYDSVMEAATLDKVEWKNSANKAEATGYLTGKKNGGGGQDWYGAPNVTELNRRLKEGWPQGSERLLKLATRDINPVSIRRRRERADQGAELDIHAVYRGDLSRAWSRTRRRQGSGVRSVTIVVNLGANCNVDADKLFWRGAAALKLANALTESGYSVAIVGGFAGKNVDAGHKHDLAQFVSIKDEDQPLDLDRLAALSAMPGYFRTALFAGIVKACDEHDTTPDWGLGQDDHQQMAAALKMLPLPQSAYVQGPINDQTSAEKWIDSVLGQIESPELQAA